MSLCTMLNVHAPLLCWNVMSNVHAVTGVSCNKCQRAQTLSVGCFEKTAASGSLGINTSSLHVWPFTCCLLFGSFDLDLAFVSSFLKQILSPYPLTESLCPSCWYRLICFLFCRWEWSQLIFSHADILKLPHDPLKVVETFAILCQNKKY